MSKRARPSVRTATTTARAGNGTNRWLEFALTVAILAIYGLLLAHPIDLSIGDLGRHLKNGQIVIQERFIPGINLFSYTFPDQAFVNHHWGSGVIFYLVERVVGFTGLSIVFLGISLLTLLIFFHLAVRYSSLALAAPLAVVAVPLLITRHEIRPELFSALLAGLYLQVLWGYKHRNLGRRCTYLLPLLQLFWVNLHIYFFLGILLIATFAVDALATFIADRAPDNHARLQTLVIVLMIGLVATCINPAGLNGALYPFFILKEYQFPVLENYSIPAIFSSNFDFLPLTYFIIQFSIFGLSWFYLGVMDRRKFSLANLLLGVTFTAMAWGAIRNFALFAYFALPMTAVNLTALMDSPRTAGRLRAPLSIVVGVVATASLLILISPVYFFSTVRGEIGLGLKEDNSAAAEFFLRENLQGPIYNNFDIGGYLVHHLYPKHQVFVDNRPEAYPGKFFRDEYFSLQQTDDEWERARARYGFNAVVFYHRDFSILAEQFLIRRILDQAWATVYFDQDIVILLRRFGPNQQAISKYEIAKEKILSQTK